MRGLLILSWVPGVFLLLGGWPASSSGFWSPVLYFRVGVESRRVLSAAIILSDPPPGRKTQGPSYQRQASLRAHKSSCLIPRAFLDSEHLVPSGQLRRVNHECSVRFWKDSGSSVPNTWEDRTPRMFYALDTWLCWL